MLANVNTHDSLLQVCGPCMLRKDKTFSCTSWILMLRQPMMWWRCETGRGLTPLYWVRRCFQQRPLATTVISGNSGCSCFSCAQWQWWPHTWPILNRQSDDSVVLHRQWGIWPRFQSQLYQWGESGFSRWTASFRKVCVHDLTSLTLILLSTAPCANGQFQCQTGDCIHGDRQCDGVADCPDGYDEADCGM